jgi:hypothetical protein
MGVAYPLYRKTLSALKYANWNKVSNYYNTNFEEIFRDKASYIHQYGFSKCCQRSVGNWKLMRHLSSKILRHLIRKFTDWQ